MEEVRDADYNVSGSDQKRLVEGTCGHCGKAVVFKDPQKGPTSLQFRQVVQADGDDPDECVEHYFVMGICPNPRCQSATILYRVESWLRQGGWTSEMTVLREEVVHPAGGVRHSLPPEVPASIGKLYEEAARIEFLSPNGAAFIARRILEQALRQEMDSNDRLASLIDAFLAKANVPEDLNALMHDVRELGNIAAHSRQSSSGEWVNVDQIEATYILGVVRELLDFVYVRPARQRSMRNRLLMKKRGELPPVEQQGDLVVAPAPRPEPIDSADEYATDDLPF